VDHFIQWFKNGCATLWRERGLIMAHRSIFVAFGIVIALGAAAVVGVGEYLWFSNTISSRESEIRIKNATIESLKITQRAEEKAAQEKIAQLSAANSEKDRQLATKTPPPNPSQTAPPSKGDPLPTFSTATGGKINGQGLTMNGLPPVAMGRAETGGEINMENATINVKPPAPLPNIGPAVNLDLRQASFPPPDGTLNNLSKQELSDHLLATAKKFREDKNSSDWTMLAIKARSLSSESFRRLPTLTTSDVRGALYIIYVYIPDRTAASEAAKFLETLAEAVRKP